MHSPLALAQQQLASLTAWVAIWRAGSYPGGLIGAFVDAQVAHARLDPVARIACEGQLARLAARVGLATPEFLTVAGPNPWQHVCTVIAMHEPHGIVRVLRTEPTLPPLAVHDAGGTRRVVDVWARTRDDDERRLVVARIESALWRAFDHGTISVFRLSPAG